MPQNSFLQSPFAALVNEQQQEQQSLIGSDPVKDVPLPSMEEAPAPKAASAPAPTPAAPKKAKAGKASLLPPEELRPLFEATASHFDVPVNVLMAIAQQESSYNSDATNADSGAKGMVQYMGATAKSLGINAADPNEAIPAAAMQIRERMDKGLSMDDAIREHFAGPDRKLWGAKTAAYGDEVLGKADQIGRELYGDTDIGIPASEPAQRTGLDALPVTPAYMKAMRAKWDAATPAERKKLESAKGYMAVVAKELNKGAQPEAPAANPLSVIPGATPQQQIAQAYANPSLDMVDTTAEARSRRLVRGGMEGNTANAVGRDAAARGMLPGQEQGAGQAMGKTDFDFETRRAYNEDPVLSNPVVRAAVKGYEGYKQGVLGINQFAGEVLGADASGQAAMADQSRTKVDAMGEAGGYSQRMFEGAVSSISQQLPALIGGAVTGAEVVPLAAMFAQSFGREYSDGRAAGQDMEQATHRAALYGTFEVLGERFGLKNALSGLRGVASGMDTKDVATQMAKALVKEIPGEQLTTLGQFLTDKMPDGVGLNVEAGLSEYLQQAADTMVQTVLQGGMMAGGATAASNIANRMASGRPVDVPALSNLPENTVQDQGLEQVQGRPPAPPSGPLLSALESAAPAETDDWSAQVMGDDGQMHTVDSRTGVVMAEPDAAPAGLLEGAVADAAEQHAADPAPVPVIEQEPQAPDYTTMPLADLQTRVKEIGLQAQQDINQRKALAPERKMIEQEIAARGKQAAADSKPAEEAKSPGPFDDIKTANKMMMRYATETGTPHEVIESNGKFTVQELKEQTDGIDTAGAGGRPDGNGGSGESPAGMGSGDGVRPEGSGAIPVAGVRELGTTGKRDGDNGHDRVPDDDATDAQQALKDPADKRPAENPYRTYQAPSREKADEFVAKKGIDLEAFEVVQTGPKRWQVQPRLPQAKSPNAPVNLVRMTNAEDFDWNRAKPNGTYASIADDPAAFSSPFADDYKDGKRHDMQYTPKNPLIVKELRVKHARFKGIPSMSGPSSAGIKALHAYLPEEEFAKALKMTNAEVQAEIVRRFPSVDPSKAYDSYEALEIWGAQEAKAKGHDIIIARDSNMPAFSEAVLLSGVTQQSTKEATADVSKREEVSKEAPVARREKSAVKADHPAATAATPEAGAKGALARRRALNEKQDEAVRQAAEKLAKRKAAKAKPVPMPIAIVKQKGERSVDVEATIATLPPVAAGHVRLYRAESPTVKFEDVFNADGLKDFKEAKKGKPGVRYTPDLKYADYYRLSYGKDASIHYIDVPQEIAEQGKIDDDEYAIDTRGKVPELAPSDPAAEEAEEVKYSVSGDKQLTATATGKTDPVTRKSVFEVKDADGNVINVMRSADDAESAVALTQKIMAMRAQEVAQAPAVRVEAPRTAKSDEPRSNWKIYRGKVDSLDGADDFLYHVTSYPAARQILRTGLVPDVGRMFGGGYEGHSAGRVFLTDRDGVNFWRERVEQALFSDHDNPPAVAVLRIPKNLIKNTQADPVGTRDARANAYFVEGETVFSMAVHPMAADAAASLSPAVQKLADKGVIVLHDDASTLPIKGKAPQGVQALTTADGTIHVVAPSLGGNGMGIVLHEAFHAGVKPLVGSEQWNVLLKRLGALHRQGEQSSGKAREFWDKARARVAAAKAKGAVADGMEHEEFGAYAIEEYESAPPTVRKWVDDLIGAVKAWALRRFGKQLGNVTPAQLSSLAKLALLDVQASRAQEAYSVDDKRTVEVDGVRHPIRDSEGNLVAPDFMGQMEFWRSYNGPVDEQGRPILNQPDERYSVAGNPQPRTLTPEEQGILRRLQANVQDSQNRIKQVQERIAKAFGVKDLGGADHYLAETNRPGRIAARKEDARDRLLEPMVRRLAKAGYTPAQLDELLHAQHAEERNEAVAKINPEFADGGSGLTTAKAKEILERYKNEPKLKALADEARNIARSTLDLKLEYGLITQDQYDSLSVAYENYVPLKGDGEYGPKVKRAMGHDEREEHILENIVRDYEQALVVGEKNLARQSLLRMVLQFADDALWTARVPPRGRYVAGTVFNIKHKGTGDQEASFTSQSQVSAFLEAKGSEAAQYEVNTAGGEQVTEFTKPLQDNEVMVYIKGSPVRIQIYDETLARQLRPLKGEQMNVVLELMRKHNRYLSMIFTGYNPAFIFKNATRDAITGTINMTGNHGVVTATKAWARYPQAWATMLQWAVTKKTPQTAMGQALDEYRAQGGKVGASYMSDLEEQGKSLQRMFDDQQGLVRTLLNTKPGEGRTWKTGFTKSNERRAAMVAAGKTIGKLAHVVEVTNQAFENALRLALFAQLRAEGKKPGIAAAAAKTVTVNFDRKGAMTAQLGAFYLFINPAIQGTANMSRTMTQGEHKYQAWGLVGMMAAAGFAAAAHGMDDDKDRWLGEKWDTRTKNLRFRVGETTINIPLSQEYAPFYAIGVAMAEVSRGESSMRGTVNAMSSFLDAYYPMNGALQLDSDNPGADATVAHVPTVAKLLVQGWLNRDGFGGETAPESDNTKNRPDHLKMDRRTKGSMYDKAAQLIATDDYTNDLSKVSPETLRLIWGTYTGGIGRFVADTIGLGNMATQDGFDIEVGDVPIVKDFVRSDNVNPIRSRFYNLSDEARKTIDEFGAAKKAHDRAAMKAIVKNEEKRAHLGLSKMILGINKVQGLYADKAVDINADKSLSDAEKRAQLKDLETKQDAIYRKAITAFTK